jgi:DNA-binding winged helix-turn-helix (wHTH) protein
VTSSARDTSIYHFPPYEFRAADAELRRDGVSVPLAPKPAQLLLLLLHHRDRIVSREEILHSLWPDVRVSDAAFHSVVRDLRRALHVERGGVPLIATLRGRGLRFAGPVRVSTSETRVLAPAAEAYVGRESILDALQAAFESARAGGGRFVVLRGAAGVGKTRTAKEIADHARQHGAAIHYGRCWRPGFAPPYRAWVELLESIASRLEPAERAEQMPSKLAYLGRSLAAAETPLEAPEPQARLDVFDAVASWFERSSLVAPLLLVLDDVEDADPATLELLEFVAGRIATSRILLLATYRSSAVEAEHPVLAALAHLARLPHFASFEIYGFDREQTRRFVESQAGRAISDVELDAVHARTDGNPLLLSLLAHSMRAAAPGDDALGSVPGTVRDWIRGRLLTLPEVCVECLQAAAAIGRRFEDAQLVSMLGRTHHEVHWALGTARRAGLLAEIGPPAYRFSHSLVQEAIYDDIPAPHRAELHELAGNALEARPGEPLLSAVAGHLALAVGRVGERAVAAAERAADQAERQLAYEEAARLRALALDCLREIGSTDARRRCGLLLTRGRALLSARRVSDAWVAALEAVEIAREIGSAQHLARAALLLADYVLADSAQPAALLEEALRTLPPEERALRGEAACALSTMLWYRGESARRRELAREARELARETGDLRLEAAALLAERHASYAPASLAERIRLASEAIVVAQRAGLESQRCLAISWRAVDLLERGDIIGAEGDVDALARSVAAERAPRFRPLPPRWRAMRATVAGRFAEAERAIREAHAAMIRAGDPNADSYAGIQTGAVLFEQGRSAELASTLASAPWLFPYREHIPSMGAALALVELEAGSPGTARRLLDETRAADFARLREDPECLGTATWLAEIAAQLGDAAFASALHDWIEPFGDRIAGFYTVYSRGALARYLGLLARTARRVERAERWYELAVSANRATGATIYEAWSQWEWAETTALYAPGADLARARALAAEVAHTARRLDLGRLAEAMRRSRASAVLMPGRLAGGAGHSSQPRP